MSKTGGSEMAWGAVALVLALVGLGLAGVENAIAILKIDSLMFLITIIIVVGLGGKRLQNVWIFKRKASK